VIWKSTSSKRLLRRPLTSRAAIAEVLEPRRLMAADPIHVGVVYLETDYLSVDAGDDSQADRFILSFTGGAPQTELTELRINLDKDGDGLTIGDNLFDSAAGGRGKDRHHPLQIVRVLTSDGRQATATAEIEDGGQMLVLRFNNFRAGDRLEFSVDVDEVTRLNADITIFNDRLDVITSGQEFHDSILDATFNAPHYETAHADAVFINDFGDPKSQVGLNLPPDEGTDIDSRPNRSAAAIARTVQTPKPIEIAGNVWLDNNLDLIRQISESPVANSQIALFKLGDTGQYVDTGLRSNTDATGAYTFSKSLGLKPGTYRLVQTQPDGLLSVGAVVGQVAAVPSGKVESVNILTDIAVPLGDTSATRYDFAEALPSSLRGFVYSDLNRDGLRDTSEPGIAGVTIRLVPINTISPQSTLTVTTSSDGSYSFTGLAPGSYEVIEVNQPVGYTDGQDTAGTINGSKVGVADNPGDAIRQIALPGGVVGLDYNFGEWPVGSIAGRVHLNAPGQKCDSTFDNQDTPLPGVEIILQNAQGGVVTQTITDAQGRYRFGDVPVGQYTIVERTPAGLLEGAAWPGKIGSITVGQSDGPNTIRSLILSPGADALEYNFCEAAPATLSGFVYVDTSNDGIKASSEAPIANTEITLLDSAGVIVMKTRTDAEGGYRFEGLVPGTYTIVQSQPDGYFDGIDTVGKINGQTIGRLDGNDRIAAITLEQGLRGMDYNFGELLPATLSGRVHVDEDGDCIYDPNEQTLAGVRIQLLDANGIEVASTTTNDQGKYSFTNLKPGQYTVIESQPEGWFEGDATVGSAGGQKESTNRIGRIILDSGEIAINYDFCEQPPAEISGTVFVDRNGNCLIETGERGLSGVVVELYEGGRLIASTTTNATGGYKFSNLAAGQYTLREIQPAGFLQGGQKAGSGGGNDRIDDEISQIALGFGNRFTEYNFCEIEPASISGIVYVDDDGDCVRDPDEGPLQGVTITLRSATGQIVATTMTDAAGQYRFANLAPGQYRITEEQPEGYLQGGQVSGTGDGWVIGADELGVRLGSGEQLVDYNFCEQLPASLAGRVWSETDLDRKYEAGDVPLPGVLVELLDDTGAVVQRTNTDATGQYRFSDLNPGTYQVRENQPDDLFHGGQVVGSEGGRIGRDDLIVGIELRSGVSAIDYNFPEVPPAMLSGYVFQDGDAITSLKPIDPALLREYRDGVRDADSKPLGGIRIDLRNVLGLPFEASRALPGYYDGDTISVYTDDTGYYEFAGLRPGTYHVYQSQPDSFADGLDTPGTSGGVAINVADIVDDATKIVIQTLAASDLTDPGNDAILNISLTAGSESRENNFSEIVIKNQPIDQIIVPQKPIDPARTPIEEFDPRIKLVSFAAPEGLRTPMQFYDEWAVTWHLSVINGGFPNGETPPSVLKNVGFKNVGFKSAVNDLGQWSAEHNEGRWTIYDISGKPIKKGDKMLLGSEDGTVMTGDFDGDGTDEAVLYVAGDWYIDFDGDGVWDSGDLWIRMGTELDRPVVGDWDGDGKDDVGIFGRQWAYDPERVKRDPGLPDPANERRRYVQASSKSDVAKVTDKEERLLRRGEDGKLIADAVDHVFKFGEQTDVPLAGDWNGDGVDQVAVFRDGYWMLDADGDGRWTDRDKRNKFGQTGDKPIIGDFDGDGIDEIGVVRGDLWIVDTDGDRRLTGNDLQVKVPGSNPDQDQPIVGDFDGDGADDIGYFRPAG
jgi:serine-aspartate repeat-containing protein C/D/E